ncbi:MULTISPECIES: aspartyl/asparaginyl beta-hydroxylase domain-containing protein [Photorhabdus]|uniref:Aspartyl/asparaginy/proline hydroxylase domain-containing protein n=1 Tax=Photorhabdus kayaii TaxID=230088 RepID=A0ABX0B2E3_9GAMM|nr:MULTISPECIES: aspartyl/asparaginyl beta-hydroxylase domain-containing protein [Photorhabdus]MCC8374507.1 aspartyl/asparaginyl beta-hydroxylase domain-containing protein [Photorhabdus bodei]MCT8354341.1 aspartyl/asparaginyl beta-hydroxylase domain-containing protein [Photorhabdus kayaii]MDB6368619.1 aspartyl/asparaginyl beta-hydroxylase domain-containing protein [Photorhabdus bodei]NDL12467.1 hypothetical protein [Photorhabdus kayaii]NDL26035.1 hypothetical protein [Photorhabdus kayaii]
MSLHTTQHYLKQALSELVVQTRELYGSGTTTRLEKFFSGLTGEQQNKPKHSQQKPRLMFFPDMNNGPWIEADSTDVTSQVATLLEEHYHTIKSEFMAAAELLTSYTSRTLFKNLGDNDWSSISLWSRGKFSDKAIHFPQLQEVITQLEGKLFPWRGEISFMRLKAGSYLPEHYDWTNVQITCHLGINIPEYCSLVVAGEERHWEEGKAIFFDHSFLHSAYNHSERDRDILLINLLHPELTPAEVYAVTELGIVLANVSERQK